MDGWKERGMDEWINGWKGGVWIKGRQEWIWGMDKWRDIWMDERIG